MFHTTQLGSTTQLGTFADSFSQEYGKETPRECWPGLAICVAPLPRAASPPRRSLPSSPCLPALQLKDLKNELGGLRVAKVTGGAPNKLSKM